MCLYSHNSSMPLLKMTNLENNQPFLSVVIYTMIFTIILVKLAASAGGDSIRRIAEGEQTLRPSVRLFLILFTPLE